MTHNHTHSHSHSHDNQHTDSQQNHNHDHENVLGGPDHVLNIDDVSDVEVPKWKKKALELDIVHIAESASSLPFGNSWNEEVSLSALGMKDPATITGHFLPVTDTTTSSQRIQPQEYHAHFDCFSGAAGDMMLAACIDSAKDPSSLLNTIIENIRHGIPEIAQEFDIHLEKVWRGSLGGIYGTKVTVSSIYHHETIPPPVPHHHHHNHEHEHKHHHHHHHDHDHHHHHHHERRRNGPVRNLPAIKKLLTNASPLHIPLIVQDRAIETFTELAMAEAHTHGSTGPESVHFHEVGAIDSIVDVVGTLLALHHLHVTSISCSRLPVGEGMLWSDHGQLPVPAFATMRLMIGMKTCKGPGGEKMTGELVTPTAAALLRVLTGVARIEREGKWSNVSGDMFGSQAHESRPPNFTPRFIGIGAGTKDFVEHPNILRVILGDELVPETVRRPDMSSKNVERTLGKSVEDSSSAVTNMRHGLESIVSSNTLVSGSNINEVSTRRVLINSRESSLWTVDIMTLLEANIDDSTPEVLAYTVELLLRNGAADAWVQPIVMKKSRSAHLLSCLISSTDEFTVTNFMELIFRNTSTIGIRIQRDVQRAALHRRIISVPMDNFDCAVDVKVCCLGSEVLSIKPEFDHCKKISEVSGLPLTKVAALVRDKVMSATDSMDNLSEENTVKKGNIV